MFPHLSAILSTQAWPTCPALSLATVCTPRRPAPRNICAWQTCLKPQKYKRERERCRTQESSESWPGQGGFREGKQSTQGMCWGLWQWCGHALDPRAGQPSPRRPLSPVIRVHTLSAAEVPFRVCPVLCIHLSSLFYLRSHVLPRQHLLYFLCSRGMWGRS